MTALYPGDPWTVIGAIALTAAVVSLAASFLIFGAMFQIFDGAQAVAAGMLRGMHDTTWPMIYAAIGYWGIGLPLGAILAFSLGLRGYGIWLGLCAGLSIVATLLITRWIRVSRSAPLPL